MRSTLHNLLTVLSIASAILLLALLLLLALGLRPYILESSSMEPTITEGSLVFARRTDPASLTNGDVVVYRTNGLLVLHRYIGDGQLQGDANSISQEVTLTESNLVGTYAFHIPSVGNAISTLMRHKWLLWALISVMVILACTRFDKKEAKSTV